ncbi:MAG: hypothetical protein WCP97_09750 [bacterium]
MKTTDTPFDVVNYVDNDVAINGYFSIAAEEPNQEVFLGTIADAAKDSGLSRIAENTGLVREDNLYKTLKVCECPCFATTLKSLGVKLGVSAITILWVFFFFGIMIPVIVNAKETKILYDNYSIPSTLMGGKQVSKSYYIKESVKKLDKNNPNILEVKVYSTTSVQL